MSGLLDRIVRHRRATASRRLGPPQKRPATPEAWTPAPSRANPSPATPEASSVRATSSFPPAAAPAEVETPEKAVEQVEAPPAHVDAPVDAPEEVGKPEDSIDAAAAAADVEPLTDEFDAPVEADEGDEWEVEDPGAVTADAAPEPEFEPAPEFEPEPKDVHEPEPEFEPAPEPVRRTVTLPSHRREPAAPSPPADRHARRSARRRARYLRSLREIQLRDLGGFLLELHRFGLDRPELVRAKLVQAARLDAELRGLERALGHDDPLREIREAGLGGACASCGAVHGSSDRFCATCGEPLNGATEPEDR